MKTHPLIVSLILIVPALAAGCRALPERDFNVCGNAAIEVGEDCDSFADPTILSAGGLTCSEECRYVCVTALECPTGWSCGSDGVCRFSRGSFERGAGGVFNFDARQLLIGDVDGDGLDDLVGGTGGEIDVRYGNGDATFLEGPIGAANTSVGPRVLSDIDDDGRADVLIPSARGIQMLFADASRVLVPRTFSPLDPSDFGDEVGFDFRTTVLRTSYQGRVDDYLTIAGPDSEGLRVALVTGPEDEAAEILPEQGFEILRDAQLFRQPSPARPELERLVLTIPRSKRIWVVDPAQTLAAERVQMIDVSALGTPLPRVESVDVNGDGVEDLFIPLVDDAGPGPRWAVATATGSGFASPLPGDRFVQCVGPLSASCVLPPLAVGELNQDGIVDFVFEDGIFVSDGISGTWGLAEAAFGSWQEAIIADVNGDQTPDVVTADSVSAALRYRINADGRYNRFDFEIDAPIKAIESGDFDGDGVTDVVAVRVGIMQDELLLAHSNAFGYPDAPVEVGRFTNVVTLERTRALERQPDGIDDLFVHASADRTDPRITQLGVLYGSPLRTMSAPLALGDEDSVPLVGAPPAVVSTGDFDPTTPSSDLIATTTDGALFLIPSRGPAEFAAFNSSTRVPYGANDDCAFSTFDKATIGARCTRVRASNVDRTPGDEFVVVSAPRMCPASGLVFEPSMRVASVSAEPESDLSLECRTLFVGDVDGLTDLISFETAQMDDDAFPEVLALFGGENAAGIVLFQGGPEGPFSSNRVVLPLLAQMGQPIAIAAISANASVNLEVALIAENGIFIATWESSVLSWLEAPAARLNLDAAGERFRVVARDLNRDGIDDLALGAQGSVLTMIGQEGNVGGHVEVGGNDPALPGSGSPGNE